MRPLSTASEPPLDSSTRNAADTIEAGSFALAEAGVERPGTVIGRYRLVRTLGRGGMGIVYRAEQQHPVRRQVALKIIKPGMDSEQAIVRFEAERQALALMDHPNIARVFDAGTTDAGRLYFVMELVEGAPVTKYCAERQLDLRARLRLFVEICQAIQHAHQKGIVHRDIKPSNVLVADYDGRPVVKVIDFGVAKAVSHSQRLACSTMMTVAGAVVGTYEYMSPEQARGDADVDTRSDVYSLGVLLYELLTETTPLEHSETRDLPESEVLRRVCDEEPPRPSARVHHGRELAHALRGDLDSIALKSLEKDPARRYATANALAADVERYLEGEPIMARPPSTVYRVGKLARRYRRLLIAAAAFTALLIAATAVSTTLAIRARRAEAQAGRERDAAIAEKHRADTQAAIADAVNRFLQDDLLAQASSRRQLAGKNEPDPDLTVRQALDRAAAGVAAKFGAQPSVEASIRTTIGNAYLDLGLDMPAQQQLERALDLDRGAFGAESVQATAALDSLGQAYFLHGKYAEAEKALKAVVDYRAKMLGLRNRDTILALSDYALVEGRLLKNREAEQLAQQAIQESQRAFGPEHPLTLRARANLGKIYLGQDALPQQYRTPRIFAHAAEVFSAVLESRRRVLGPEHPDTLDSMTDLSTALHRLQRFAEAEAQEREIIAIRSRVWGPEHPSTLAAKANLSVDVNSQGKVYEAQQIDRELLAARMRIFGPEHPATLETMWNLANDFANSEPEEAEKLHVQILAIRRRTLGVEHPDTMNAIWALAGDHGKTGKPAEAVPLYLELAEVRRRVMGPGHPQTMEVYGGLARAYRGVGKFREAEEADTKFLKYSVGVNGADNEYTHFREMNLALDYLLERKYAQAVTLGRTAFAGLAKTMGRDHERTRMAAHGLAAAWHAQGHNAEAKSLMLESLATDEKVRPEHWHTFLDRAILGAATQSPELLQNGFRGMVDRQKFMNASDRQFVRLTAEWLAEYYAAADQPDQAAEWRMKAERPK